MMDSVTVTRRLDGKGRLILPGDFREAGGFAADELVDVAYSIINGQPAFIITKKELGGWHGESGQGARESAL